MSFYLGAYASSPALFGGTKDDEVDFFRGLRDFDNIDGLELPFWGVSAHEFGDKFLFENLSRDWRHILTCVPGNFNALKTNTAFGLASSDERSRKLSVDLVFRARAFVLKINDYFGHKMIRDVQLCSAPSAPQGSANSSVSQFSKSLEEILNWNWDNANLNIEHCDAASINGEYQKGFLPICDEIYATSNFPQLGFVINWARSVIESKNVNGAVEHIKQLKKRNLLRGVIFSGTAKTKCASNSWLDDHVPLNFGKVRGFGYSHSLLTQAEILRCIEEVKPVNAFSGMKISTLRFEPYSHKDRVPFLRENLTKIYPLYIN